MTLRLATLGRTLRLPANDYQHLWYGSVLATTDRWWAGLAAAGVVELVQLLFADQGDFRILDRVADVTGWAVCVPLVLLPWYLAIPATVLWYLALLGMRKVGF